MSAEPVDQAESDCPHGSETNLCDPQASPQPSNNLGDNEVSVADGQPDGRGSDDGAGCKSTANSKRLEGIGSSSSEKGKQSSGHHSEGPHKVELIAKHLHATVKWYNGQMHYGFLVRTDTQREVFVHRNSIVMSVGEPPWLNRNQAVTFDLWTLPCGRYDAKNVRSVNGSPISFGDPGSFGALAPHRPPPFFHGSANSQHFRRQQPGFVFGRPNPTVPFNGQYGYYCPVCGRSYDYGGSFGGRYRGSSGLKPLSTMNLPRMNFRT
ncbi:hypothetical protein BIW11_08938 [Tropilaelaps mercedesae]|uniref:CSD domain-containing protein n=1 Tax=Tropilaelaps mercedesae TaxID=418985 RepID=A0A1V9XMB4_9ACAR|nr:hypothetical protein BIW11_08938 [Tropilaelaps mercedesae]